jgi:hypothetical protein
MAGQGFRGAAVPDRQCCRAYLFVLHNAIGGEGLHVPYLDDSPMTAAGLARPL